MTVIVWDGFTLAGDRNREFAGIRGTATKVHRLDNGGLIGCAGHLQTAAAIRAWLNAGANPSDYPKLQQNEQTACDTLVVLPDGQIGHYETAPIWLPINDPFIAVGSGADVAYGALAMGADAIRAVKIACALEVHCGAGVDWLRLDGAGGQCPI